MLEAAEARAGERDDARDRFKRLRTLVGPGAQPGEDRTAVALEEVEDLRLRDAKLAVLCRAALPPPRAWGRADADAAWLVSVPSKVVR